MGIFTRHNYWSITGYTEFTTHKENGVHKKWLRHAKIKLVVTKWRLQYGTVFFGGEKKYQYPSHAVLKERCLLVYWFLLESVLIYTIKFVDLYYIMCLFELAKIAKTTCFPYYIKIGMGLKSNEYCVLLHTKHYDIQPLVRWQRFKLSFCFNDIKCV